MAIKDILGYWGFSKSEDTYAEITSLRREAQSLRDELATARHREAATERLRQRTVADIRRVLDGSDDRARGAETYEALRELSASGDGRPTRSSVKKDRPDNVYESARWVVRCVIPREDRTGGHRVYYAVERSKLGDLQEVGPFDSFNEAQDRADMENKAKFG